MKEEERRAALRIAAKAYAGREGMLTLVLQYVYQTAVSGGETGAALRALAADALLDFERLGSLLGELGADPVFTACPPYPVSYHSAESVDYSKSLPAMLAADCRLEEAVLRVLSALKDIGAAEALKGGCERRLLALGELAKVTSRA